MESRLMAIRRIEKGCEEKGFDFGKIRVFISDFSSIRNTLVKHSRSEYKTVHFGYGLGLYSSYLNDCIFSGAKNIDSIMEQIDLPSTEKEAIREKIQSLTRRAKEIEEQSKEKIMTILYAFFLTSRLRELTTGVERFADEKFDYIVGKSGESFENHIKHIFKLYTDIEDDLPKWSKEEFSKYDYKLDQAISEFFKILSIDPGDYEAMFNLGVAYYHNKFFDKAEKLWQDCKLLMPQCPECHCSKLYYDVKLCLLLLESKKSLFRRLFKK